ncbi:MFS transporter [Herbiconiux sp. SYSU D00978]|uniref:MFS transporter n=1 Tax=Herbiconiux sp. SYSU D00978 TaxID=2812562 RepID=UPI001A972B41|nr:MFS transporter [Herbiconiux sp. SYSU D00978]
MSAAGYLISSVPLRTASGGVMVAIPLVAIEQTGSVALGGALTAAALAPAALAAPLAGVALDRSRAPRRLVLLAAAVTAIAYAAAAFLGVLPVAIIAVALVAAGCMTPFLTGGLSSFVTEEIDDERRAYATDAMSYNFSSIGGPAIVAIAVSLASARTAMLVLAAVALVGGVASLAMRMRPRSVQPQSVRGAIVEGTRHLVTHRPLAIVTLSSTLTQLGQGGLAIAAVALSIERAGSEGQAAVIVTAFAVGALIGSVLMTVRRWTARPPEWVMAAGFLGTGVATLAAVPDLGLPWTVFAVALSGLFTASSSAAMLLLRKQQSPPPVRSQVFTVGAGLRIGAAAAGAAIAGQLAGLDAGLLIALVGIVWVVSAVLLLAYPRGTEPLPE